MSAPRILILDDELAHGSMLQELLEFNDLEADVIGQPQKALEAVRNRRYALAITDYRMPTMNGVEWMRKAREIVPGLPVMIISGVMDITALSQASQWGVDFVFEKPIDVKGFVEQVKGYALGSRAMKPLPRGWPTLPPFRTMGAVASSGTSFPQPLNYLAAQTPIAAEALKALWAYLGEGKPVWIVGPVGSEIEYILKEVACWQKADMASICVLSAADFKHESIDKLLTQWSRGQSHERIVLWGGLGNMPLGDQEAFIGWLEQLQTHLGHISFIVWIEAELFGAEPERLSPRLMEVAERCGLYWPPLRRRLADMATYVTRWMQEDQGADWKLRNVDIAKLVAYDWPKNFCELRLALKYFLEKGRWPATIEKVGVSAKSLALKEALVREQSSIFSSASYKLRSHSLEDMKRALYIEDEKMLDATGIHSELIYSELIH